MPCGAGGRSLSGEEVNRMMADEKAKRRFMFCGRCAAVLSVLLFVPVLRRLRAERQKKQTHRHFPIFGH